MIKRNIIRIAPLVCLILLLNNSIAQIISPFNDRELTVSSENCSFIVSGHFHGSSGNLSTFPASTLLAGIDTLNSLKPDFIISLGDLFLDVNEDYISNYRRSLFSKLKVPLFNAVGNHDVANNNVYEKLFGKSYFHFILNANLFIVLNTEVNDGSIKGSQLVYLKELLEDVSSNIKNIFVFSHRPVWAENNERYKDLFSGNTRTVIGSNNYNLDVLPIFKPLTKNKKVFWISGSLGNGPASFFYDKDPETNITFMQTAIRDLPRDAVLMVKINESKVSFKGISLTGKSLSAVESYNINFWSRSVAPESKFNFRLLPLLVFQMLLHHYFWSGFFSSLILLVVIGFIFKKWKRRK